MPSSATSPAPPAPAEDLIEERGRGLSLWFETMDAPCARRNGIHLAVCVPHDRAQSRVAAAIAASGHLVNDQHAPSWCVLADAEGNDADVATTIGRD